MNTVHVWRIPTLNLTRVCTAAHQQDITIDPLWSVDDYNLRRRVRRMRRLYRRARK